MQTFTSPEVEENRQNWNPVHLLNFQHSAYWKKKVLFTGKTVYFQRFMQKVISFLRKLWAQFCIMHNNKEFHVLEREEYRQLKGTEVDLMRVTCKLQTFWYSGSSFRLLFRCNRTKTLRQIDSKAIQLVFCRKNKLFFRYFARQGLGIG